MLREARRAFSRATAAGHDARRWRLIGAAAALGTAGAGCSLLYDLSTEQCTTNADCSTAFGPNYTCNAVHVCEAPQIGSTGGSSGSGNSGGSSGSSGNAGTTAGGSAGTDSGGSAGSGPVGCTSNSQCIDDNFGTPFVCRSGQCVNLLSNECPFALAGSNLDNLRSSENPIILGAYTWVVQGESPTNNPPTANYELALREFTEAAGGLDQGRRKFVIVGCNGLDSSTFATSLDHLIDQVQVPGIIAPLFSNDLATLFVNKGHASNVFFLSPIEADSRLTRGFSDDGLVWNILGSAAQLAPSYVPLLERTEAYIHSRQTTQAPIKVALINDETVYEKDISDELIGTTTPLAFNDVSLAQNLAGGCGSGSPDAGSGGDEPCLYTRQILSAGGQGDYDTVVDELDAFQPDVIIALTSAAFVPYVMETLEAGWDSTRPTRPFYLMGPYQAGSPELQDAVQGSTAANTKCDSAGANTGCPLFGRLLGINYESARDPAVLNAYRVRWNGYPEYRDLANNFENFYDAAWYMFYAIAAAGNVQLTGSEIARGMQRLVNLNASTDLTFAVGPTAVNDALLALTFNSTSTIELDGAMGPPDFDPGTGARKTLGSAYCYSSGGTIRFDILRYESSGTPSMSGAVPAPCSISGF